jgi:two-component system cell cycle sensor histidine kinase/response regulator CckA
MHLEWSPDRAAYERMIETTQVGVWVIDAEGKTTFANARMATMLGYEHRRDLIGRSPAEFTDHEGRARFRTHIARHQEGLHGQSDAHIQRKDGTWFWAIVDSSPILDEAGRLVGAFAMFSDDTARREAHDARVRAEEAQRTSEAEYRFLFDNSPLPKWVYDTETLRILAVNDATVRMYGYSREQLLVMTIADTRPAEDVPLLKRQLAEYMERPRYPLLTRHRKNDGTVFEVEIYAHTFQRDGRTCRLVVGQDITERRRLEEQLRQAQKMEAVGRLAGGVAHDFNNMLSVVLSYGEMLLADLRPGEPMRDEVQQIVEAGNRAAALTRQLLMFSRQQVLAPQVLDLGIVLGNVEKMLCRTLGADVDLTLVGGALGRVWADVGSIEQVLMNLVINARDAMPTGGHLTIETTDVVLDDDFARAHMGSKPGPHVMLAVTDTGTGMDAATVARIFEPFFTTKANDKGTGLGLSTVFGIVQQSGGTIWVDTELGKGTTFKVYLPRVDAPAEKMVSVAPPAQVEGAETILLVDDDGPVRAVARAMLEKAGYKVMDACNAGEALLVSEKYPDKIHLLLTDVVMPHASGPELAQRLASARPDMKVLCMSGYTDDSVVRHGIVTRRVAFLQKPITRGSLTGRVRAVLDERG